MCSVVFKLTFGGAFPARGPATYVNSQESGNNKVISCIDKMKVSKHILGHWLNRDLQLFLVLIYLSTALLAQCLYNL
jgi:hypothetical protein